MKKKNGLALLAGRSLDEGWSERSESNGFTLIELLVVIIIMGIIAAVITGNFFTSLKKGRDARRKADLEQVQKSLEMYYEDKKAYPTAAAGAGFPFGRQFCETSTCDGTEKVYMQKVSDDPVGGRNYLYASTDGKSYQLYACLENDQQILPYTSTSSLSCTTNCKDTSNNSIPCLWGVSSSNINP